MYVLKGNSGVGNTSRQLYDKTESFQQGLTMIS